MLKSDHINHLKIVAAIICILFGPVAFNHGCAATYCVDPAGLHDACNPDSYCKRVAMASPNPVTKERKKKIKVVTIKKPGDSCVYWMAVAVKNNNSIVQLLVSIFILETRLFWD